MILQWSIGWIFKLRKKFSYTFRIVFKSCVGQGRSFVANLLASLGYIQIHSNYLWADIIGPKSKGYPYRITGLDQLNRPWLCVYCWQKEEEKLRASVRRESKQKRVRERGAGRGLSTSYLEPDQEGSDDEGGISLSAIKSKYKKGGKASKS